jgi:hypothetical protein
MKVLIHLLRVKFKFNYAKNKYKRKSGEIARLELSGVRPGGQ